MATYTLLNKQELQLLANNYNLKIINSSLINGGNGNSSYIIKTQNSSYVLTVCDDKTTEEVFNLGQLLVLLKDYQIPCNRIVLTTENKFFCKFQTLKDKKPVMLKKYINGGVQEQLDKDQLMEVGKQLAQLNRVPVPSYLAHSHSYGLQIFKNILGLNIDLEYESWLTKEIEYLDEKINKALPKGLIHGDLFYDNIIFDSSSNMPGGFKAIIDFEEACNYYLVFELGMCILGTCVHNFNIDFDKARALVIGYQKIRKLENLEKISLQSFVRYAATATSYWRFTKYNIKTPIKDKANDHMEMVQISTNIAKLSSKSFFDHLFC